MTGKNALAGHSSREERLDKALLAVRGLCKSFVEAQGLFPGARRTLKAVDGVDLAIDRGESFALVGESGSGKTTLARCLLRLIEPDAGSVVFDGIEVTALPGLGLRRLRARIQMVFQNPYSSLNPRMAMIDIVKEPLIVHTELRGSKLNQRVSAILEKVGLSFEDGARFPLEFSGGQKQRIALARALVLQPELLMLDEPTSALDVSVQAQILNLLSDLKESMQLTYVLITHDLGIVRYLADRVAVMYLGKIVEEGPTTALFQDPKHPYTQVLISAIPVIGKRYRAELKRSLGEIPSGANIPSGCRFHTRCDRVIGDICREVEPSLESNGTSHFVACHRLQRG